MECEKGRECPRRAAGSCCCLSAGRPAHVAVFGFQRGENETKCSENERQRHGKKISALESSQTGAYRGEERSRMAGLYPPAGEKGQSPDGRTFLTVETRVKVITTGFEILLILGNRSMKNREVSKRGATLQNGQMITARRRRKRLDYSPLFRGRTSWNG